MMHGGEEEEEGAGCQVKIRSAFIVEVCPRGYAQY